VARVGTLEGEVAGAAEPAGTEDAGEGLPRRSRRTAAAAAAVFVLCLAAVYAGFGPSHWRQDVPLPSALVSPEDGDGPPVKPVVRSDYRLGVWAVARNARALVTRPHRLFDAEPCHPAPRSLALHHPVIAPAVVALPFVLATGEPVLAFNLALLAGALVAAAAMFLLVRDWTGSAAAATTAAVLYAFHGSQLGRPHHFFTVDNAWMLFGLYYGRRLLVEGRWRDVAGFAAACVLQASASFYPLLAALALGLPAAVWLVWLCRARPAAPGRLAVALALAAAGGLAVLMPYLLQGETLAHRSNVFFAPWSRFAPGGELFPGALCSALALAGLLAARRRAMPGLASDPRPALVVGLVLVVWLATGGNAAARLAALYGGEMPPVVLPNPFAWLRGLVPGLANVRLPSAVGGAAVPVAALLAGLGTAALLRRVPGRWRAASAAGIVALACVDTLWPADRGFERAVRYVPLAMRPDPATLGFYAEVDRRAPPGALLELPLDRRDKDFVFNRAAEQHLLAAWHRRRTSGCYSSFIPKVVDDLAGLQRLGRPGVRAALREQGFGAVIVHHPPDRPTLARFAVRAARAADRSGGELRPIARAPFATAYALEPPRSEPGRGAR